MVVPFNPLAVAPSEPQNNHVNKPDVNRQSVLNLKCSSCSMENTKDSLALPCGCIIHMNCVKINYAEELKKAKSKINVFNCKQCNKPIAFEFFDRVTNLSPPAKKNAKLLMFSHCKFRCPVDDRELNFCMVSKKFKARNKKCEFCNYKYCSFCQVKGGHRFYCDLLKGFKNDDLNQENYIIK